MIIIGLVLLAAAVVAAVELVLANDGPITFSMWGWSWQFDAFWLAVVGAVIVLVGLIGLGLLRAGGARSRRHRRERRDLAAENRRLAERAQTGDEQKTGDEHRAEARDGHDEAAPRQSMPMQQQAPVAPPYGQPVQTQPVQTQPVQTQPVQYPAEPPVGAPDHRSGAAR